MFPNISSAAKLQTKPAPSCSAVRSTRIVQSQTTDESFPGATNIFEAGLSRLKRAGFLGFLESQVGAIATQYPRPTANNNGPTLLGHISIHFLGDDVPLHGYLWSPAIGALHLTTAQHQPHVPRMSSNCEVISLMHLVVTCSRMELLVTYYCASSGC
ncbi:hypothetical protein BDV96DRAFT_147169 [Lophiotrema nucula]|uniref:Uncharacterized protein n=1 Tax=Lophiotrema nucula TaxID=690887 RepID=A0A6A5Z247_9PLEO|nr:hypothetical protein BDV96DRAFT_147169 [Lophiotrema nucula]